MIYSRVLVVLVLAFWTVAAGRDAASKEVDVAPLLQTLRQVGPKGQGHREAMAALERLSQADAEQLPQILAGLDEANPLAMNWIRGAADAVAQRAIASGAGLPQDALEKLLADKRHNPRARRLAFELLEQVDPSVRPRLIPTMLDDPSPELRRDAVASVLREANELQSKGQTEQAIQAYRKALAAAGDADQIESVAKALTELGVEVDLPAAYGFVVRWRLIGPFDNTDKTGFDTSYPPEKEIDLDAEYDGKLGKVAWVGHTTEDKSGMVDLNAVLGKHLDAAGYAYAEFVSDREQEVELRLGCMNANKVWLNGELIASNEVYQTLAKMDQYVGRGKVRPGVNTILIKVCQDNPTADWAQKWQFQLRVCDAHGRPLRSQTRGEDNP